MSDPVRTVEKALADRWEREGLHSDSDPEVDAWTALQALVEDGWRIVRTESVEASTDDGPEWLSRVVEEWTPNENDENLEGQET